MHWVLPTGCRPLNRLSQVFDSTSASGCGGHNGNPQRLGKLLDIDFLTACFGDITHVDRQHHRLAQLKNLADQKQIPLQLRGADHAQNSVNRLGHRRFASQHIDRHQLVR